MAEYKMRKQVKRQKNVKKTLKGIKYFIVGCIAFALASMAGLNLYLASLEPIENLEEFKSITKSLFTFNIISFYHSAQA